MMESRNVKELTSLSLSELDKVLKMYPWFSLARREFFFRLSSLGDEYRKEGIRRAAVYVFSRDILLKEEKTLKAQKPAQELTFLPEDEVLEKEFVIEDLNIEVETQKPVIHIIGGDYFGKDDLESLQKDGLTTIERMKSMSPDIEIEEKEDISSDDFLDEEFYTETLAKIYAKQGFYKRASDVYAKLILLYPEKSTYFAALNEEIKKYL